MLRWAGLPISGVVSSLAEANLYTAHLANQIAHAEAKTCSRLPSADARLQALIIPPRLYRFFFFWAISDGARDVSEAANQSGPRVEEIKLRA